VVELMPRGAGLAFLSIPLMLEKSTKSLTLEDLYISPKLPVISCHRTILSLRSKLSRQSGGMAPNLLDPVFPSKSLNLGTNRP
jgi:hypothetical protein